MGSLVGKGLDEAMLAYTFDPSEQKTLFDTFGGLIQTDAASSPGSASGTLAPWEEGLWAPTGSRTQSRNQILATWGHRTNVVLADGVENGSYIPAVIELNAR